MATSPSTYQGMLGPAEPLEFCTAPRSHLDPRELLCSALLLLVPILRTSDHQQLWCSQKNYVPLTPSDLPNKHVSGKKFKDYKKKDHAIGFARPPGFSGPDQPW